MPLLIGTVGLHEHDSAMFLGYGLYRIRRKNRADLDFSALSSFRFLDDVTRPAGFARTVPEPESAARLASADWRASAVG